MDSKDERLRSIQELKAIIDAINEMCPDCFGIPCVCKESDRIRRDHEDRAESNEG